MTKKKGVKRVAAATAKKSSSYADYAKRLAALLAAGVVGAAVAKYQNKQTYNQLKSDPRITYLDDEFELYGSGDYGIARRIGRNTVSGIGGVAGGMLGSGAGPLGAGVGASVGSGLGHELGSYIFGEGDYTVAVNSLATKSYALQPGMPVPQFGGISNNATRVRHREFVQDLVVPANPLLFNNLTFVINPGNAALFPWLAAVAAQYQQYEIHGMVVEFRPLSSDITAGGALGSIIIATNYDVLENAYTDKVRMENAQYSVSAKPSLGLLHTVECDPKQRTTKLLYVRDSTSSITTSQDARFMDMGRLQIATMGLPGSTGQVLGELWVSYDVSLYKPEVATLFITAQTMSAFVGSDASNIFGTSRTTVGSNNFLVDSPTTIRCTRAGVYCMTVYGGVGGAIGFTISGTATTTLLEGTTGPGPGGTVNVSNFQVVVPIANATVTLVVTGSTWATNVVRFTLLS